MRPEELRTRGSVELRKDGDKNVIVGYAATFDTESHDMGGFREVVRASAFERSLREKADVIARANHHSGSLLGRTSSGTLRLSVDERGLRYEVDVPDTTGGRDTMEYIRRGDIHESSFAFRTPKDGARWAKQEDGSLLRELVDVDLVDVSPVADEAAYPETQVSARVLEQAKAEGLLPESAVPAQGVPHAVNEARYRAGAR